MNPLLVATTSSSTNITNSVGFGTAALGQQCHSVVLMALKAGFRYFDTAEENQYWYNAAAVASALRAFHQQLLPSQQQREEKEDITTTRMMERDILNDDECVMMVMEDGKEEGANRDGLPTCVMNRRLQPQQQFSPQERFCQEIRVSTKIPPWELISYDHIRNNAKRSRAELMSFCDTNTSADTEWTDHPENHDGVDETTTTKTHQYYSKMPLDVYYIHAPACWKGWHTQCDHPPHTMDLRSVWLAMEAVVGLDHSARRIGLSNVRTDELLDIIHFVQERQKEYSRASSSSSSTGGSNAAAISRPPPRLPDVVQSFADPIEPAIEIRKICAQYQIEFVSYSTLGTQHVYKSTNPSRSNPVLTHPTIVQLAEQYQRSTAEIVLSWALQNQMSIIPRSSQKVHIQQLARLLPNSFQEGPVGFLTANDLAQIDLMKA